VVSALVAWRTGRQSEASKFREDILQANKDLLDDTRKLEERLDVMQAKIQELNVNTLGILAENGNLKNEVRDLTRQRDAAFERLAKLQRPPRAP
jgi:chromosome segregation ATPase